MIVVRFAGGLGNQLFQLAAATLLRDLRSRNEEILYTDATSRYEVTRSLELVEIINPDEIGLRKLTDGLFHRIVNEFRIGRLLPYGSVSDRNIWQAVHTNKKLFPLALLDGYFQDHWTEEQIMSVRGSFLDHLAVERKEMRQDECIIHVRGGDFSSNPRYYVADLRYYECAISRIVGASNCRKFRLASDDPILASSYLSKFSGKFPSCSFSLIEEQGSVESFRQILSAPQRIIGNSTFALWAAILDENKSPTVSPHNFEVDRVRKWRLNWEVSVA